MIIGLVVLRGVANFISHFFMAWVGRNVIQDFRLKIFDRFLVLPVAFFDRSSTGQLLSKVTYNAEQVAMAATEVVSTILQSSCLILGLLGVMFINSWRVTLLYLGMAPLVALIVRQTGRRMRRISQSIQTSMVKSRISLKKCYVVIK